MTDRPRIGLALGTGAARGWAHIGVIQALAERGIRPDIVCGTSIGALVGASWAADDMGRLEEWLRGLTRRDVLGYMDFTMGSGLIHGRRLFEFFRERFEDQPIAELAVPWGAVATDMHTGMEVWLREGSTLDAVRASISLPGLFTPVKYGDRWLVDGGLVNPVPISMCRALGAETVIAVDISSFRFTGPPGRRGQGGEATTPQLSEGSGWLAGARAWTDRVLDGVWGANGEDEKEEVPSLFEVLSHSINIMQARIARSRMAGDPPDVLINPRMEHIALMDFHRAGEAIEGGRAAVRRADPALEDAGLQ
ncbi:MAG: patatin-like phospholipase RssA [Pseudomonadota bacterium]